MVYVYEIAKACRIFEKLCPNDMAQFDITRPEVETSWDVVCENKPNSKQLKTLQQLGWIYDEDNNSFGRYF